MSQSRKLFNAVMQAVPQKKYYGNPFEYILENWEAPGVPGGDNVPGTGQLIVHATADALGDDPYDREDIEPAKIAHDIWINMLVATVEGRHTDIVKDVEDFYFILESVERLYPMGLSEREIKDSYYKELSAVADSHLYVRGKFSIVLGIMDRISREALAEHDHVLDEQINNNVKEMTERDFLDQAEQETNSMEEGSR